MLISLMAASWRVGLVGEPLRTGARALHCALPTSPLARRQKVEGGQEEVTAGVVQHLERLSLVNFADRRGVERLEEAVRLARLVEGVDTAGVEPLYSTLEAETLALGPDTALPPRCRAQLMAVAALTEEEYYVAPVGNVPLSTSATY